jgi:uncharacterized DUF497 family protein
VKITWDAAKAAANEAAHGVKFAEAATVLEDELAWKANKRQRVRYEKGRG